MRPVDRSSTLITRWPSASSRSARCEPMNPAPPVTRTVRHAANLSCGSAPMSNDVRSPRASAGRAEARDHRGVVGAQRRATGTSTARPASSPSARQPLAQPRVRDDAAAEQHRGDAASASPPRSSSCTCTSTIASWKLAARSGRWRSRPAARSAFTWRSTAVFSPLSEKSKSPESSIARGKRIACGIAVARHRGRAPARPGTRARSAARPCRRPPPPRRPASGRAPRGGGVSGMWTSIVWPPLTISATYGGSGGPCSRKFAQ